MLKQVEDKLLDVDILSALVKEAYQFAVQSPCRYTRGRAGWELHKLNRQYEARKKELVQLCDQAMSSEELYDFLHSQNINLQPL